MIAIAENIEDMDLRALELAFTHLERNHNIAALPTPAEIRELGNRLREEEIGRKFREREEQRAQARNDALAERVARGEDQYFGLADLAKVAREKYNMRIGDDKKNRETPKQEAAEAANTKRDNQANKVALHKAQKGD